jgi:NDP-sugar pyrophosphorylase family protein
MAMQCVLLAGGLATRMRPLTDKIPKSLIPAGGRPFVDHQLRWLARSRVDRAVFLLGYKGQLIRDFVGDGQKWGINAQYVDDGPALLGTGGALRKAFDQGALDESFLLMYGDSFLPIAFGEVWDAFLRAGLPAMMTVLQNEGKWGESNACVEGGLVTAYEKARAGPMPMQMKFIDYGLSALRRDALEEYLPPGARCDVGRFFSGLSARRELGAFRVGTRFYEVGSPAGLADFERYLASGGGSLPP